ncbi:MAG: AAA family ATPase [Methanospirillum sp.]
MAITALTLRNFRSFREAGLRLRPFTLLVGRNAAGKSNLIHGFLFLRDIARSGLANAISLQGGLAYLQNAGLACGRDLGVEVELTLPVEMSALTRADGRRIEIAPGICTYTFALGCNERAEVREDRFVMRFVVTAPGTAPVPGSVELVHEGDRLRYAFDLPPGLDEAVFLPPVLREARLGPSALMLESPTLYPMGLVRRALALVSCYEFGPRLTRRLELRTGAAELAEDGSNAAIALGRVLADPERRRQFLALLRDLLPFVEDVVVGNGPGGAPEIRVAEVYAPGRYLPAEALSSGTVELFALLVALFFSPRELAIFEEPVARLHPLVVGRLVGLMRDASAVQPLLVSTQHPAVLRHAPVEDVCLVSRDEDGFSILSRPADRTDIKTFLEEEVGLDELFLADLL